MAKDAERSDVPRVLIVEDEGRQLRTLTAIMEAEGFEVIGCSTGSQALAHFGRGRIDVAVVDLRLPDVSEVELIDRLRALAHDVPIIINTAYSSYETARDAVNSGAFAYVEKAIGPAQLVHHVHRAARSRLKRYAAALESAVEERTGELQHANQALNREVVDRKRAEEALQTSREQLRLLAAGLQAVREEERTRLARKIHDELGHALAAVKMDLSWLDKKLTRAGHIPQDGPIRERMKSIFELLDATIVSIRETASDLRPGLLDDLGLSAALEWMIKQFQHRTGIRCTFAGSAEDVELDRERSTALYRICQELLTNVVNHANAKAVKIALEHRADELLVLVVSDDGKGITRDQMSSAGSLGILGIRERVLVLGGQVHIAGASGKGTTATVQIPLVIEECPEEETGDPSVTYNLPAPDAAQDNGNRCESNFPGRDSGKEES